MKPIGGLNFFKKFIFYLINRRRASGSQLITFHIRHDEKKKKKKLGSDLVRINDEQMFMLARLHGRSSPPPLSRGV
jgi:hypothetical protein